MTEKLEDKKRDPKDFLANERTFLAWIRTSIGIMAFGFVVEKFTLFLKQLSYFLNLQPPLKEMQPLLNTHQNYISLFGALLVGFGAVIGLLSFLHYKKVDRQIQSNLYVSSNPLALLLAFLVVIIALFLISYLLAPLSTNF